MLLIDFVMSPIDPYAMQYVNSPEQNFYRVCQ